MITQKRTDVILKALQEKHGLEYCAHYGEPGYQDPGALIADIVRQWKEMK